jgi:hypothetical protein
MTRTAIRPTFSALAALLFAVIALAATTFAMTVSSQAQPKFPEYDKVWEDGALRKQENKGFKAKSIPPQASAHNGPAMRSAIGRVLDGGSSGP